MSFTKHDYNDLGGFTIGLWTKKHAELLSIFDLPRLQEAMSAFVELENVDDDGELVAASQDPVNPDRAVMDTFMLIYSRIFLKLWDRGVLEPIMVLEEVPESAQEQLDSMVKEVEAHTQTNAAVQQAPAPVVVEDPITTCVREYHEMGSSAFKTKWINNTKNRAHYEAAIDQGRI
jgi:hypothetical protein